MASKPLKVLRRRSEFLTLMKNGQKVRPSDWMLISFSVNRQGEMRCGWTLPRYIGSAVIRNRLKRWSRVYFKALLNSGEEIPVDVNLVFRRAEGDFYRRLNYECFSRILDRGWQQIRRRVE